MPMTLAPPPTLTILVVAIVLASWKTVACTADDEERSSLDNSVMQSSSVLTMLKWHSVDGLPCKAQCIDPLHQQRSLLQVGNVIRQFEDELPPGTTLQEDGEFMNTTTLSNVVLNSIVTPNMYFNRSIGGSFAARNKSFASSPGSAPIEVDWRVERFEVLFFFIVVLLCVIVSGIAVKGCGKPNEGSELIASQIAAGVGINDAVASTPPVVAAPSVDAASDAGAAALSAQSVDHESAARGEAATNGRRAAALSKAVAKRSAIAGDLLPARSRQLCPGLVVPNGSECVLVVPIPPKAETWEQTSTRTIRETSGTVVLKADLVLVSQGIAASSGDSGSTTLEERVPVVRLRAANATSLLIATCKAPTAAERRGLRSQRDCSVADVCNAHDEHFATLARVTGPATSSASRVRFALKSDRAGFELLLHSRGNSKERALQVTGGPDRRLLADAEPCSVAFDPSGDYFRLRVTEGVDVGLILCALLSIWCFDMP